MPSFASVMPFGNAPSTISSPVMTPPSADPPLTHSAPSKARCTAVSPVPGDAPPPRCGIVSVADRRGVPNGASLADRVPGSLFPVFVAVGTPDGGSGQSRPNARGRGTRRPHPGGRAAGAVRGPHHRRPAPPRTRGAARHRFRGRRTRRPACGGLARRPGFPRTGPGYHARPGADLVAWQGSAALADRRHARRRRLRGVARAVRWHSSRHCSPATPPASTS